MPRSTDIYGTRTGFTLLELLVVISIIAVLCTVIFAALKSSRRAAKKAICMNNLRQFCAADIGYLADTGEFPPMDGLVPSSITPAHLEIVGRYLKSDVPDGKPSQWPKRAQQPQWMNCPFATMSGYAEGPTMGGGLYTGYLYVGGIQDSRMVKLKMATLTDPEHSAPRTGYRRGVLWADILAEFIIPDYRRYENFHCESVTRYKDFRFKKEEIDGIHRAWSDGSVEWVPVAQFKLGEQDHISFRHISENPSIQIKHTLGNFYY
jgi:prepilin-type N-terminal cleavage/methylation domain-containing protein